MFSYWLFVTHDRALYTTAARLLSWSFRLEAFAMEAFTGAIIVPLHYGDSHPGLGRILALTFFL